MKVVVIDNFSTEAEQRALASLPASVIVVTMPDNRGFAAGVNAGLALAQSDWVVFMNPDVEVAPADVLRLVARAKLGGVDLATPTILRPDGKLWFCGGSMSWLLLAIRHHGYGRKHVPSDAWHDTQFVSGCMLALSPDAQAAVTPLREDLFMYWEDVDLSLRARRAGLRLAVDLDSLAVHGEGASSVAEGQGGRSALFHYYQSRNRLIVLRGEQVAGGFHIALSTLAYLLMSLRNILRLDETRWENAVALTRGTWHGVRWAPS